MPASWKSYTPCDLSTAPRKFHAKVLYKSAARRLTAPFTVLTAWKVTIIHCSACQLTSWWLLVGKVCWANLKTNRQSMWRTMAEDNGQKGLTQKVRGKHARCTVFKCFMPFFDCFWANAIPVFFPRLKGPMLPNNAKRIAKWALFGFHCCQVSAAMILWPHLSRKPSNYASLDQSSPNLRPSACRDFNPMFGPPKWYFKDVQDANGEPLLFRKDGRFTINWIEWYNIIQDISEYIWNALAQSIGWKPETTWGHSCLAISLQSISLERFKEPVHLVELAFQAKLVAMLRELSFWKRCAAMSRELCSMFAYGRLDLWLVAGLLVGVGGW